MSGLSAFDKDAGGRERSGMRRYRIFRPVDNHHEVMLDLDFDMRCMHLKDANRKGT